MATALEDALISVFDIIIERVSSGTAAAVVAAIESGLSEGEIPAYLRQQFKSADEGAAKLLSHAQQSESAPVASHESDAPTDDDLFARRRFTNLAERLEAAAPTAR